MTGTVKKLTRAAVIILFCVLCVSQLAGCGAGIEVYDDISRYGEYMSFGTHDRDSKWNKWGMDESIWPGAVNPAEVTDFKMVCYDPWDAQYLGYLVVDYTDSGYEAEVERLRSYPSTEYIGYYGVQAEKTYELLAVNADSYLGFVYALTDGRNRIVYAEQIFCNYFMDIDYEKYIPADFLLDGFNAKPDNPYRVEMMK